MHRPFSHALLAAVERLATAESLLEMLDATGGWVELGLLDAVALWLHDPIQDVLHLARHDGIPPALTSWRAGPRAAGGPVWRALDSDGPVRVDLADLPLGLAVPLRDSAAIGFALQPLRGPAGEAFGVVLAGRADGGSTHELPWTTLGRALHRAHRSDQLRWRAQWLDALLPLISDGVIVGGPDGQLYAYSGSMEALVGWTADEVRTKGWLPLVYPDAQERDSASSAIAALIMGEPSRGVVRTLTTRDGRAVDVEVYSAAVPHPSEGSPALVGLMRDVTQARKASRTRARDDALTRLGRMAGGVAHEFNNLLGAIMGHAELVAMSETALEEHRRRARMVVAAAQRGGVLSKQLLAFSGATIARITPVPTGPLIEELVELYRPTMPSGLQIDVDTDRACPIEADPAHLQQALMNLLVNAGEAARTRMGLTIDTQPLPEDCRFVSPQAPPAGTPMCRVRVWDDGEGFSAEARLNLFEPFWTGKPGGHGLGLAAVRGIVGLHEGALQVSSRPQGGAQVDVYLPISTRPELALPDLVARHHPERGCVWLVDDEVLLLEFAAIALRSAGYHVRSFDRGALAVEAAEALDPKDRPDVLVIDVVMPGMDGPTTVSALRRAGIDARLLWTSGYSPEHAAVPDEGSFLQKPYAGTELRRTIQALLEGTP